MGEPLRGYAVKTPAGDLWAEVYKTPSEAQNALDNNFGGDSWMGVARIPDGYSIVPAELREI